MTARALAIRARFSRLGERLWLVKEWGLWWAEVAGWYERPTSTWRVDA